MNTLQTLPNTKWIEVLLLAVIAIWVVLLYQSTLGYPMVFDDEITIETNPYLSKLWPLTNPMQAIPGSPVEGRPLVSISFALNYQLTALDPWSYRAGNILIFILSIPLVYVILKFCVRDVEWLNARVFALVVTALWSLHPLHVDSIVYITQRTELMYGFFLLLSLFFLIRAHESTRPLVWLLLSWTACFAGMFCKEVMVVAPLLLYLFDRCFITRSWPGPLRQRLWFYVALPLTWAGLAILVMSVNRDQSIGGHLGVTVWDYFRLQMQVILWYLLMTFWPSGQAVHHEFVYPRVITQYLPSLIAVMGMIVLSFVALIRYPRIGFAGLWFFMILAPTSSILPIVTEPMAERRMLMPVIAVLSLAVLAVIFVLRKLPHLKHAVWIGGLGLIVAMVSLSLTTRNYASTFQSNDHLWQRVLNVYPDSSWAMNNLGVSRQKQGKYDEALELFIRTLEVEPTHALAPSNIAWILIKQKRYDKAMFILEKEIQRPKADVVATPMLALVYHLTGRSEEALPLFQKAVEMRPNAAFIWNNYASTLDSLGRYEEAVEKLEIAWGLQPVWTLPHRNLARIKARLGRYDEALDHVDWLLSNPLTPDLAVRVLDLGAVIHMVEGRPEQALRYYQRASEIAPDNGVIQGRLVRVMIEMKQLNQARAKLDSLSTPFPPNSEDGHPIVLDAWARFYDAIGDPEQAKAHRDMAAAMTQARDDAGLPSIDQQMSMDTEVETGTGVRNMDLQNTQAEPGSRD